MSKHSFVEAAAIARSHQPCSPREASDFAHDLYGELTRRALEDPLDVKPGAEWSGENLQKVCAWLDAMPVKIQKTFVEFVRERYR